MAEQDTAEASPDQEDSESTESEVVKLDQTEETAEATADEESTGESEQTEEEEENEIVHEGGEGSQPTGAKDLGTKKRVSKLVGKFKEEAKARAKAEDELRIARDLNDLQERELRDKREQLAETPLSPPDVKNFDDGAYDPEFQKKFVEYATSVAEKTAAEKVQQLTQQATQKSQAELVNDQLLLKYEQHYEKAVKLKLKDYEATEDIATTELGKDITDSIIYYFPDKSAQLLFFYGKNPQEAEILKAEIRKDSVQGFAKIVETSLKLKSQPSKKKTTPDPDTEIEGVSPKLSEKRGPEGAKFY